MKCKCHPLSAFHWMRPDYPQQISWRQQTRDLVTSQSSTQSLNNMRLKGIEVPTVYGLNTTTHVNPKRFAV